MRLQSQIWVAAYLRQVASAGVSAMLTKRGEASAGAIYIKVALLDRTAFLYSPALLILETSPTDRSWQCEFGDTPVEEREVDEFLKNQTSFDRDLWIIEVEDRQGRHFLDDQVAPAL